MSGYGITGWKYETQAVLWNYTCQYVHDANGI